jgi:hypothetical protein
VRYVSGELLVGGGAATADSYLQERLVLLGHAHEVHEIVEQTSGRFVPRLGGVLD